MVEEEELTTVDDHDAELASLAPLSGLLGLDRHYEALSGRLLSVFSAPDVYLQLSVVGLLTLPCVWTLIYLAWRRYRQDINAVLEGGSTSGEEHTLATPNEGQVAIGVR